MSRRSGQSGSVCVKGTQYIGRYRVDVPGQVKRARRTGIIGSINQITRPHAERWLSKFIGEQGLNDASHLARSQSPVVTFGVSARGWREHHLIVNKKRSSQRSMSCELLATKAAPRAAAPPAPTMPPNSARRDSPRFGAWLMAPGALLARSNALANAWTLEKRSRGSLASARASTCSTCGARSGRRWRSEGGSSRACCIATSG